MNERIEQALTCNASSLGFHWIYNHEFLKQYSKSNEMFMKVQDQTIYQKAQPSYYAYPFAPLGTVTVQGEILKWLLRLWEEQKNVSLDDYRQMLLSQFRPGGNYRGYVESYGKRLVLESVLHDLGIKTELEAANDNHLVGFVPYMVSKSVQGGNENAYRLARLFTKRSEYISLYTLFDQMIERDSYIERISCLEAYVKTESNPFANQIRQALRMEDTEDFIKKASGRACSIDQSIPLIMHFLAKYENLIDALQANMLVGGAIADRAMILGFLYPLTNLPSSWFFLQ